MMTLEAWDPEEGDDRVYISRKLGLRTPLDSLHLHVVSDQHKLAAANGMFE
jgi:hypothetical protein